MNILRWLFGSRIDIPDGKTECVYRSEIRYNELLKTTPFENVRLSVGKYRWHPHQWVEVWDGNEWQIDDPTLGWTEARYYRTSHHLEWEMVMQVEGKLKELAERSK